MCFTTADDKLIAWAKKNLHRTQVDSTVLPFGKQITDVGAQALASLCPNLTSINLSSTQVTDVGAQALANAYPKLTSINLDNTKVTDVGAQALADACPNLTTIGLSSTQVTAAAKQQMKAKLFAWATIH
eukprot:CAMPEP_0182573572 /NCGR_PEP_ID=MMETSP1324-20130603/20301_1 /TAXON_ID=236786 /ORGANISM="Florenciella sp., Strain RCC1587" /LENGTH=128 /DNA_ID=CAMNT_0024788703 /DNA_START=107 /DNA_END=493 /DNA_ORIENTATION=-